MSGRAKELERRRAADRLRIMTKVNGAIRERQLSRPLFLKPAGRYTALFQPNESANIPAICHTVSLV